MARETSGSTRLLLLFGALSLAAVSLGAFVCARSGVPAGLWIRNVGAWVAGALAATRIAASAGRRTSQFILCATALALGATLVSTGEEGVHRWIQAGPLRVNVALLLLPAAVVALAALCNRARWSWLPALSALAILVAQPDASQATAFGAAIAIIVIGSANSAMVKGAMVAADVALIAASWLRPDPLQPVPEVEGVIALASSISPALAVLALALLIALAVAPALLVRRSQLDLRLAGMALSTCLAWWVAAPFLGQFPVPLVGIGLSPVIGSWLGVGVLAAMMRRQASEPPALTTSS
jgi:hypothetical protein